mgnify:CR=1 FL=1
MESVITATLALIVVAGPLLSLFQERFFAHLQGKQAFWLSVALALAFGIAGTVKSGFIPSMTPATDPFSFALNVVGVAIAVLVGSQAAFRALVRPVSTV